MHGIVFLAMKRFRRVLQNFSDDDGGEGSQRRRKNSDVDDQMMWSLDKPKEEGKAKHTRLSDETGNSVHTGWQDDARKAGSNHSKVSSFPSVSIPLSKVYPTYSSS